MNKLIKFTSGFIALFIISLVPVGNTYSQHITNTLGTGGTNPKSKIDFKIPLPGIVLINVYNLLGQEITQFLNESMESGYYSVEFDGSNYPSGIYIYKIVCGGFSDVKKLILVK
jgi:hypothetical protein